MTEKLCRELAACERSTIVHARREAARLGEGSVAAVLSAIANHAEAQWPRLEALRVSRQPFGLALGSAIGHVFSAFRSGLLDWIVPDESSYLTSLQAMHHGIDIVRFLAEIAVRSDDPHMLQFCREWLTERMALVERAEQELAWFADRPAREKRTEPQYAMQGG